MTVLTEALVLKKRMRGDFDRHYILLTKEFGKINVLAKSAAKVASKLSPHLELFGIAEVMLAPGVGGYRLAGAKIKSAYKNLNRNLFKLILTSIFLEAIDLLLLEKAKEERIFLLVEVFFDAINQADSARQSIIIFNQSLFRLLTISGYEPSISAATQSELSLQMIDLIQKITDKKFSSLPALKNILQSA